MRNALVARGVDAMSCDLLPSETERPDGWDGHYRGDLIELLDDPEYNFDIGIFHPDCTFLCNSGVRWLRIQPGRFKNMLKARKFFLRCWNEKRIDKIAIENPIPHHHAKLPPYTQIIQPWMFGDYETKATCLWLKHLSPLVRHYATAEDCRRALGLPVGTKPKARVHLASPGPDRWKERSRTSPGIANAMAEQWGTT